MDADWITSSSARRVLQHADDSRPAWLWSGDGSVLLWQNDAAQLFLAKIKKHGLKRAPLATPIKGQVSRIIRLGSPGRTSLSRVQFIAGERPGFATCACTPLQWQDDQPALLVVGVDAIAPEILAAARGDISGPTQDFAGAALSDEPIETAVQPSEEAWRETAPEVTDTSGMMGPPVAPPDLADDNQQEPATSTETADEQAYERELDNWHGAESDSEPAPETVAVEPAPEDEIVADAEAEASSDMAAEDIADEPTEPEHAGADIQPAPEPPVLGRLGALFDRMAQNEDLYTPLTAADDEKPVMRMPEPEQAPTLYRITGSGFVADDVQPVEQEEGDADIASLELLDAVDAPAEDEADEIVAPPSIAETVDNVDETTTELETNDEFDSDLDDVAEALTDIVKALEDVATPRASDEAAVERVSRYNFDELSRILNERVSDRGPSARGNGPAPVASPSQAGELVNLSGETLVLNRLPLGILVFRDQQVLFANRAITEMVGYESVETLRNAGLAAIFPAIDGEQHAGPVNHLVQRDGTLVPVTARLQSISWQGRPALMLSASMTEVRTGHEDAVRAFAEMFAGTRGDGFIETNRAGVVSAADQRAASLLGRDGQPLAGRPLSALIAAQDSATLREFLERPARFAETARPAVSLRGVGHDTEIMLFARGQAGVITGYFGLVHRAEPVAPLQLAGSGDIDPALLARISRGVRRPLNTIVGFSDLIRSGTFGALGNERYETYAQDISSAGQEIAALVDELDDYTRLRDGRYLPHRASIDLLALLENCVVRIRGQAGQARVIVRSAISEKLPRVTADRPSLVQAVLNLLASAVDQTPMGGAVVISAQREDDGGIAIHVRDSSTNAVDMAERFVVFREGTGRDGQVLAPVRSSVGLALTRSLLAVNAVSLSVDPAGTQGMLFSLLIPGDLVDDSEQPKAD